jgi:hypothetical protein
MFKNFGKLGEAGLNYFLTFRNQTEPNSAKNIAFAAIKLANVRKKEIRWNLL